MIAEDCDNLRSTLSAVQTASFMLLWLQAIAVILAAPSWTSWMFLMYLPGQRLQRESLSAGEGDEEDKPQLHDAALSFLRRLFFFF